MKFPLSVTIRTWLALRTLRSDGWQFSDYRKEMFVTQSKKDWERYYSPINVTGLTVLDVGAGEGETARFYLEHGARKVICIEPDSESFELLNANSKSHPIVAINRKFLLDDIDRFEFDLMKMDIEGYEEALLSAEVKKPCVIEVHGLPLRERFMNKGYDIVDPETNHPGPSWLSYAYKNIPKTTSVAWKLKKT